MHRRSIAIFFYGLSLTALGVAGCDEASSNPAATSQPAIRPMAVRVADVASGTIDRTVEVVGTLFGEDEAIISSKSSGRVVEIIADLGDRLASGDILAEVDKTDYRFAVEQRALALSESLAKLGLSELPPEDFDITKVATVQRASVQTENAKARLDRAKQLYDQQPPLISEQEYADIETQYRVFQQDYDVAVLDAKSTLALASSLDAALRIAKQQLLDTTIRAPVSETAGANTQWAVAERRVSIGELVQSGTTMYKVIADRTVKLRAAVPEQFAGQIAKDQVVSLRVDSISTPASGVVSRVSPSVDVTSRTFSIEATFDNEQLALRPGAFARATVVVGKRSDVTVLPGNALFSFAGLDKVFTIQDGKAVQHIVNVLQSSSDRIVVEGDLGGAKSVITSGLARLANGSPVTLDSTPAPQANPSTTSAATRQAS